MRKILGIVLFLLISVGLAVAVYSNSSLRDDKASKDRKLVAHTAYSVEVVDDRGQLVIGAEVKYELSGKMVTLPVSNLGTFVLPKENIVLWVGRSGHVPVIVGSGEIGNQVVLKRMASLRVLLQDAKLNPVSGATVIVETNTEDIFVEQSQNIVTLENGVAVFAELVPDTPLSVDVISPPGVTANTTAITLAPGEFRSVTVSTTSKGVVIGRYIQDGLPASGVTTRLMVSRKQGNLHIVEGVSNSISNPKGQFRLIHSSTGTAIVRATWLDKTGKLRGLRKVLELTSEDIDLGDIHLDEVKAANIAGKVLLDHEPVSECDISLWAGDYHFATKSDSDGQFECAIIGLEGTIDVTFNVKGAKPFKISGTVDELITSLQYVNLELRDPVGIVVCNVISPKENSAYRFVFSSVNERFFGLIQGNSGQKLELPPGVYMIFAIGLDKFGNEKSVSELREVGIYRGESAEIHFQLKGARFVSVATGPDLHKRATLEVALYTNGTIICDGWRTVSSDSDSSFIVPHGVDSQIVYVKYIKGERVKYYADVRFVQKESTSKIILN